VDCPAKNARIITQNSKASGIWMGVRPGELVGHQPCSITLWWLVRVRPAPPRSRLQPEKSSERDTLERQSRSAEETPDIALVPGGGCAAAARRGGIKAEWSPLPAPGDQSSPLAVGSLAKPTRPSTAASFRLVGSDPSDDRDGSGVHGKCKIATSITLSTGFYARQTASIFGTKSGQSP